MRRPASQCRLISGQGISSISEAETSSNPKALSILKQYRKRPNCRITTGRKQPTRNSSNSKGLWTSATVTEKPQRLAVTAGGGQNGRRTRALHSTCERGRFPWLG